ncbi:hypothetical protein BDN71DRAFT_1437082 [Pleurotus eryngii]|uniref:Uncharacterized protein n=1 Tax=Pleurotus eryngii TaxID=5323 RepID=A0A9P6D8T9_PLEER|nr:hypothetical protein BDN71DRAFT_1437082 [Pleurotus eryngii]
MPTPRGWSLRGSDGLIVQKGAQRGTPKGHSSKINKTHRKSSTKGGKGNIIQPSSMYNLLRKGGVKREMREKDVKAGSEATIVVNGIVAADVDEAMMKLEAGISRHRRNRRERTWSKWNKRWDKRQQCQGCANLVADMHRCKSMKARHPFIVEQGVFTAILDPIASIANMQYVPISVEVEDIQHVIEVKP